MLIYNKIIYSSTPFNSLFPLQCEQPLALVHRSQCETHAGHVSKLESDYVSLGQLQLNLSLLKSLFPLH